MVRNAFGRLAKNVRGFLAALSHTKNQPSPPDPRRKITRTLFDATHVAHGGANGAGGNSTGGHKSGEKILGKAISQGYEQER